VKCIVGELIQSTYTYSTNSWQLLLREMQRSR